MNGRLIAVGDIHGCHLELAELLDLIAPTPKDRLVFLGDLINRGPDSGKVIDLARQHRAICLLGNHELRLLNCHRSGDQRHLKGQDIDTFVRMRPSDWEFIATMPLTFEEPELRVVCVHGGFLPHQDWRSQPAEIVTRIQAVDRRGRAVKCADEPDAPLWADLWRGPPFVIYGHIPRPQIIQHPWSVGLDTACVMGGHLTAYVLPEKRFIQVKARQRYHR